MSFISANQSATRRRRCRRRPCTFHVHRLVDALRDVHAAGGSKPCAARSWASSGAGCGSGPPRTPLPLRTRPYLRSSSGSRASAAGAAGAAGTGAFGRGGSCGRSLSLGGCRRLSSDGARELADQGPEVGQRFRHCWLCSSGAVRASAALDRRQCPRSGRSTGGPDSYQYCPSVGWSYEPRYELAHYVF